MTKLPNARNRKFLDYLNGLSEVERERFAQSVQRTFAHLRHIGYGNTKTPSIELVEDICVATNGHMLPSDFFPSLFLLEAKYQRLSSSHLPIIATKHVAKNVKELSS